MTNLTLYWLIPKDRSSRVRWLLREFAVEFSEQQMNASAGEHRSGDYLDVNPFGKVPAIVTGDLTLSESGAIPVSTGSLRHRARFFAHTRCRSLANIPAVVFLGINDFRRRSIRF